MKNLFAIVALCVATVAMAQPAVDVYLDVTDVDNVTITALNQNGTYGGAYFAIDGLQFFGAVNAKTLSGPMGYAYPDKASFGLGITVADGNEHTAFASDPVWMEYGVSYNLGSIVSSSNPADFSALADGETGKFLIVDAGDPSNPNGWNGLGNGSGKLLGQIVPEPASMSMLALGALAMIRRRR